MCVVFSNYNAATGITTSININSKVCKALHRTVNIIVIDELYFLFGTAFIFLSFYLYRKWTVAVLADIKNLGGEVG